jgi:hypothetical protein
MGTQRHVIKRQVIELTVSGAAQAQPLQDEISRIYRQRLIPLIDQCLTEMSDPDKLYRIESLELDLGVLDPQQPEDDFVEKVNNALRRELAAQISNQEHARGATRQSPGTNSHLELFALFVRTGNLPWWAETSNPHLLAENLKYLLHNAPKVLGPVLQELGREPRTRQRMVNQYTDDQLVELTGLLVPAYKLSIEDTYQALLRRLQNTGTASGWQNFQLRRSLWNNLLLVASLGGQEYLTFQDFYQAVLNRIAIEMGSTPRTLMTEMGQVITNDNAVVTMPTKKNGNEAEARMDSRFGEADEVYITNAGLVILWPFLEDFFAHVNLLESKQFKDRAAQQRAVGLLQVLATHGSISPEYLLPLNKILCGQEVEEVVEFGAPLLDTEAEECERLLGAVIAQAPILHDMTTNGFRGTFLLRPGVLSVRDGLWLLQVEKETYDVVLERFPWSWQWVKLPWMDAPMRVEW